MSNDTCYYILIFYICIYCQFHMSMVPSETNPTSILPIIAEIETVEGEGQACQAIGNRHERIVGQIEGL